MFLPLFFGTRFAHRCPQSLELPFRGAKSSQKIRAASWKRPAFRRRDLLPAARKALRLRSGEQNLHRESAPPLASDGPFSGAICSPLPAKPCGFVPGSKIFTEIPRRHLPPSVLSAARFAPRCPQSLAASFRGAKSSQRFRAATCLRRSFLWRDLLPAARKALRLRFGEQNLHRNSAPLLGSGRSCWRRPPATPYATAGPRQQGAPKPACRPIMLAPPRRQTPMPPSGHANRAPQNPPAGQSCWRRPAGNPICHRRATPTGRPESCLPANHVGAAPPATPYATVGARQQGARAMREMKKTADTYPS